MTTFIQFLEFVQHIMADGATVATGVTFYVRAGGSIRLRWPGGELMLMGPEPPTAS